MSVTFAPRTCMKCGRNYSVKASEQSLKRHRMGVCPNCKSGRSDAFISRSDYSRIKPISDDQDDTRPVWKYRALNGVLILLPGDVAGMAKRLRQYWSNRLQTRVAVRIDVDGDHAPTGTGLVIDADTRRIYDRVQLYRIETRAVA